jgi:hypothetical protein
MVGDENLIVFDSDTVSPSEIARVVVIWLRVSEVALMIAHALLAGKSFGVVFVSRLFFAAFSTTLCPHEFATSCLYGKKAGWRRFERNGS